MTKTRSYGDRVKTNFSRQKVPKENTSYECLSLIMLDSVVRVIKKYYPQTLFKEYKHDIRKVKQKNLLMMI